MHIVLRSLVFVMLASLAQAQTLNMADRPEGPEMVVKTFTAEMPIPAGDAVQTLQDELGHLIALTQVDGIVMAGFAGFEAPAPLRDYLIRMFPEMDPGALAKDMPVSLSLAIIPDGDASLARVMLSLPRADKAVFGAGVPKGAVVLMDDASAGQCRGQVVLAHPAAPEEAAPAYLSALEASGFTMETPAQTTASFFAGHRGTCRLFLYAQPDFTTPDRTLVVVRFTEE